MNLTFISFYIHFTLTDIKLEGKTNIFVVNFKTCYLINHFSHNEIIDLFILTQVFGQKCCSKYRISLERVENIEGKKKMLISDK